MEFPMHWLILALIVVLLFGGKKIPEVMRGLGEGIRSFREGMHGNNSPSAPNATPSTATPVAAAHSEEKK